MVSLRAAALVALAACGTLDDGDYAGDARFDVMVTVDGADAPDHENAVTRIAVSWWRPDLGEVDTRDSWQLADIVADDPWRYRLRLYEPPAPAALADLSALVPGATGRIAVGRIFVFDDLDDDGVYDSEKSDTVIPEQLRAGVPDRAILYTEGLNAVVVDRMRTDPTLTISNPDALHGYDLARRLCSPEGHWRDAFEVLPRSEVRLQSFDAVFGKPCTR
jgi:hypothetical protein